MSQSYLPSSLADWQRQYAQWFLTHKHANRIQKRAVASEFAGTDVGLVEIMTLMKSPAWKAYLSELSNAKEQLIREAQTKAIKMLPEGIDVYRRMLRRVDQAKDYKSGSAYVVPILDRVLPKHEAAPIAAPLVTINFTAQGRERLERPYQEVEVEAVPLPPADPEKL